jgi:hypothetical protein
MGAIRTHWYADDLLKQYPSKGDKYVIDEKLQHTDHLFLGVACFTFVNFVFKTFDFSILYTTLPHDKLKTPLKETIHKAFSHRNYGSKFVVLGYNSTYFSNKIHKGKTCYSEEQVI